MELIDIIKQRNLTITQAAKKVECSRPHLSDIIHHKVFPGLALSKRIAAWTNYAITEAELLGFRETPLLTRTVSKVKRYLTS